MKQIIDEKLYDTENSQIICEFKNHRIYRTNKGTLFMTYFDNVNGEQVSNTNRNDIKDMIGMYVPSEYIKIFREVGLA